MKLSGEAASGKQVVVFPDDKRQVIIQKMILVVDGQPDRVIDLTQPIEEIKKKVLFIFHSHPNIFLYQIEILVSEICLERRRKIRHSHRIYCSKGDRDRTQIRPKNFTDEYHS